jgi:hypothetical protein
MTVYYFGNVDLVSATSVALVDQGDVNRMNTGWKQGRYLLNGDLRRSPVGQ